MTHIAWAQAAIRRHQVRSYFLLAYGISWSVIFAIVGVGGLRFGDLDISRGMLVWGAMLAGPSISGILLTWLVDGWAGLCSFRDRLTCWRLPLRWYGTLLVAPVVGTLVVTALWAVSSDFKPMAVAEPDKALVAIMFVVLVFGAFVEELGWTGFATLRIRLMYGVIGSALLIGVLHGAWHFLADFSGRGDASYLLYVPRFLVFWIGALIVLRRLMVWGYEHTGSLLLGQLLHASYTAPLFLLTPPDASNAQLLVLWTLFALSFAAATVGLIALGSPEVRRKPQALGVWAATLTSERKSRVS